MSRATPAALAMLLALAGPSCVLRPMSSTSAGLVTVGPPDVAPDPPSPPPEGEPEPDSTAAPAAAPTAAPTAAPPAAPVAAARPPAPAQRPAPSTSAVPTPKLLSDTDPSLGSDVRAKLDQARDLVSALELRVLSIEQSDLLLAGKQFVGQGADAIAAADLQRAEVLADKALVMLQELEQATRP